MKTTLMTAVLGMAVLCAVPARAATIYTDSTTFLAAIDAGYYLETFDSLPQGEVVVASPLNFSGAGFTYSAATWTGLDDFENQGPIGDTWLSTRFSDDSILLTFTSGNVTAVGGNFFVTDLPGNPAGTGILVTLNDGTTQTLLMTSSTSFLGFTFANPILSLLIDADATDAFATVNDLIVGQAAQVPEPAALAMLGLGALLTVRRRRSLSNAR